MGNNALTQINNIQSMIYSIRNVQVILDFDLARLYNVETRRLNEQVKRNKERFPENYMFQLIKTEWDNLKSQFAISSSEHGGRRYLPYAFTEQGVAMLSAVLRSDSAVQVSIRIMDAFVKMRRFFLSNAPLFERISTVERKQIEYQQETDKKFQEVFDAIEARDIKPQKGIFFDGQIFDAHIFVSELIRSAKKSIILIDNYIDDSVLTLLTKKSRDVSVRILTSRITKQLALDVKKFNQQYGKLGIKQFSKSHDRFLIIDNIAIYHIGASLKDLGNKWFAFSKFDENISDVLKEITTLNDL